MADTLTRYVNAFCFFLGTMCFLHCYWFLLFLQMIHSIVVKKQVVDLV